jgi:hypothetical protein
VIQGVRIQCSINYCCKLDPSRQQLATTSCTLRITTSNRSQQHFFIFTKSSAILTYGVCIDSAVDGANICDTSRDVHNHYLGTLSNYNTTIHHENVDKRRIRIVTTTC